MQCDGYLCIDSDADYPESDNGEGDDSGYYYSYYYGSEQKYLEELKFRLISELEVLMTCSYQFGTKFDQASLQVESGHETGRSVPEQGGCAFPARTTPDHKSNSSNKEREMINNLITHLKEEASEDVEHKGWCNTELTTNSQTRKEKTATVDKFHATVDELKTSMENLAMEVAKPFAQVSHQVDNDPFVKVKKLIQDLIWKL